MNQRPALLDCQLDRAAGGITLDLAFGPRRWRECSDLDVLKADTIPISVRLIICSPYDFTPVKSLTEGAGIRIGKDERRGVGGQGNPIGRA